MSDGPSHFEILAEACRRLGLKPREATLLRDCLHAWTLVENGHLLITPGRIPAARRLMERGYLAETPEQPMALGPGSPEDFGLVVVAERDHFNKLIKDANATLGGATHQEMPNG